MFKFKFNYFWDLPENRDTISSSSVMKNLNMKQLLTGGCSGLNEGGGGSRSSWRSSSSSFSSRSRE